MTLTFCVFQVYAAWCCRRFPSAEPWLHRPRSSLLFLLRLLHQVRLWCLPWHLHSQFRVSIRLNTHNLYIVSHSKPFCRCFIRFLSNWDTINEDKPNLPGPKSHIKARNSFCFHWIKYSKAVVCVHHVHASTDWLYSRVSPLISDLVGIFPSHQDLCFTKNKWITIVDVHLNINALQCTKMWSTSVFSFIIASSFSALQATSVEAALNQRQWI